MLNNQASIAGQTGNAHHLKVAGEHLSCADHSVYDHRSKCVGADHLDQQDKLHMTTIYAVPADPLLTVDGQMMRETLLNRAVDHPSTSEGQEHPGNHDRLADAHHQELAGQRDGDSQSNTASGFDSFAAGGQPVHVDPKGIASCCNHLDDDGQCRPETQVIDAEVVTQPRDPALIAHIRTLYKQRNDIIRAHGNLTRQVISICRHTVGYNTFLAEKERSTAMKRGDKMLADLKAGEESAVALVGMSAGYLLNVIEQSEFDKQKKRIERLMEKSAIGMGADQFIADTKGFSYTMLANIIGEAGDLANYGTVSRLWKRMGLAVIDGKRQSKQSDVATAMAHGYNPARRSAMWNIGESILKQQLRNIKDEEGNRTDQSIAIGPYGEVYLDHKKRLAAERQDMTKAHIHNRAKRYMEKRLLRDLWRVWNRA